jgi:hypothetical protein
VSGVCSSKLGLLHSAQGWVDTACLPDTA